MQQSMNTETSDVTMTLTKRIRKLNRKVSRQSEQIERIQDVVYQLLGGLFNQRTQNEILSTHIDILYGNNIEENEEDKYRNNKKIIEDISPTTRQGDMLLERVESIEERLREIAAHRESETKEETNSDTDSSSDYEPSDDDEESDDNDSSSDYEPSDEESETEPDTESESETESETDEEAEWDSDYEY